MAKNNANDDDELLKYIDEFATGLLQEGKDYQILSTSMEVRLTQLYGIWKIEREGWTTRHKVVQIIAPLGPGHYIVQFFGESVLTVTAQDLIDNVINWHFDGPAGLGFDQALKEVEVRESSGEHKAEDLLIQYGDLGPEN